MLVMMTDVIAAEFKGSFASNVTRLSGQLTVIASAGRDGSPASASASAIATDDAALDHLSHGTITT